MPEGFPEDLELSRETFRNWDRTITADSLWTCTVRGQEDVLAVLAWALDAGYRVRPHGYGHSWSPVVTEDGTDADDAVVLLDMTALDAMEMEGETDVRVQAGARMDDLLEHLHEHGRSLIDVPAPGDVTVAGVLAVGGHGTAVPAEGEERPGGGTYGTVSNLVVRMTVVGWDAESGAFAVHTLERSDPRIGPLLVSLGRVVVLEVVLRTVPDYTLRCLNHTAISADSLFAKPEEAGRYALSSLLDRYGRVGIIWFAFTDHPWVQTWEPRERRPFGSRRVSRPYNYPFADELPDEVTNLIAEVTRGAWHLTPLATASQLSAAATGLSALGARDMFGDAKNFLHFVRPTTLKVSAASHVVLCRREDVQRVVHEFTRRYLDLQDAFRDEDAYPANNTCEIRVTGLDHPGDLGIEGAATASLSAAAPVPGRPELDTAVWLDVLNLPGTPRGDEFFAELESWFHELPEDLGVARPEWAKRFATTAEEGSWRSTWAMTEWLPGQVEDWAGTAEALEGWDPHGVLRTELHDRLWPRPTS